MDFVNDIKIKKAGLTITDANDNNVISLSNDGTAEFYGGVTVSELEAIGNSTFKGTAKFNGRITTSEIQCTNIRGSRVSIGGEPIGTELFNLNVPGTFNRYAEFNADATFNSDVRFNGYTNFNNVSETNTYISNALINDGTSTFNGVAEFNKAVEFNNNVTIGTSTSSTEYVNINVRTFAINALGFTINASEVHNNLATFNNNIIVDGKSFLNGAITTGTEIVTINGETTFTRGVTVSELDVKHRSTFNTAVFNGLVEIKKTGRLDAATVSATELSAKEATFDGASIYNGVISASEVNVSNDGNGKITADYGNFSSITVSSSEIHDGSVIFNDTTKFNDKATFDTRVEFTNNSNVFFYGTETHTAPVYFKDNVKIGGSTTSFNIESDVNEITIDGHNLKNPVTIKRDFKIIGRPDYVGDLGNTVFEVNTSTSELLVGYTSKFSQDVNIIDNGNFFVGDDTEFVVCNNGDVSIRGTEFTIDEYGIAIGKTLTVGPWPNRKTLETGTISAISLIADEIDVDSVMSATGYRMAESEFYAGPDAVSISVPLTVYTTELHTGQATFSGDVNFENKPILGGDIEEVFITKSDLDAYVDIESDQTVTGDKIFTGSTVVEEIEILGNAVFSGNTTFEEIEITGNATFGGETTIEELDVNTINGNSSGLTINLDGANYIQPIDAGGAELTISVTELHTAQTTFAGTTKFTGATTFTGEKKFTGWTYMDGASITELIVKNIRSGNDNINVSLDGYSNSISGTNTQFTISVTELHTHPAKFNSYVYFNDQIPELKSPASTTKPTGNKLVSANWVSEFIYESKPKTIKADIPAIAAAGTYWTGVIDIGSYPIVQVVDKTTNKVSYVDLTISEVSAENETYCIGITPGRAVTANEFMYIVK